MYGVLKAITKFNSQFVAVVMESALARTLSGKISPVTTQATGPPNSCVSCFPTTNDGNAFLTRRGKSEDEDAATVSLRLLTTTLLIDLPDECDGCSLSWKIVGTGSCAHDSHDELRDTHDDGAHQQEISTS